MKIRLEIPGVQELPSQGRNTGSIPVGSTRWYEALGNSVSYQRRTLESLLLRRYYRATLDSDESGSEFVFFVGWNATHTRLVFEDGNGDVHVFRTDEVEFEP